MTTSAIIRADASLRIGSGHIHRCLALAAGLRAAGCDVQFLTKPQPGDLNALIRQQGFDLIELPSHTTDLDQLEDGDYAGWLGCSAAQDAEDCLTALAGKRAHYLIVDHYSLDKSWSQTMRASADRILVIDDLANRELDCDILLNQNHGFEPQDYQGLLTDDCQQLLGAHHALLRPGFAALRETALERRQQTQAIKRVLLALGSYDSLDRWDEIISALNECSIEELVVTGDKPNLAPPSQTSACHFKLDIVGVVDDMEQRMARADFAIGAAGSSSWERCCLGLPSAIFVAAENQRPLADAVVAAKAAWILPDTDLSFILKQILTSLSEHPSHYQESCNNAAALCDGKGVERVLRVLQQ